MLSIRVRLHNLCSFLVIILCVVLSHARPVEDDNNNVDEAVLGQLRDTILQSQESKNVLKNLMLGNYVNDDKHISLLKDNNEISKTRRKRVGFAGLENLDMIISTLGRSRNRNNRFQPALSISGNFGDLRSMMQKAG